MKCNCGSRSFVDGGWRELVRTLKFGDVRQEAVIANRYSSLLLRCANCSECWTLLVCTYPEGMTLSIFVPGDIQASEQTFAAAHELSHLETRVRGLEKDLSREHIVW